MKGWQIAAAAFAALGVAAAVASESEAEPATPSAGGGSVTNKQRLYAQLRSLPMLDEDQRLFLILVAHGESKFNPLAHNDSEAEKAASGRAYDRIAERFADCGRSRDAYAIGSVGRFQRLAPYFCNDLRNVVPCISPLAGLDGLHDIPSAIATAHALQGYKRWQGTVISLRAGWATPGWMDAPPAAKVEKWTRHANEAGLPAGFVDRKLADFTDDLSAVISILKAGAAIA